MKKFLSIALGGMMLLSLCACTGNETAGITMADLDLTDTAALLTTLRDINDPMQKVTEDSSFSVAGGCSLNDGTTSDFRIVYYLDETGSLTKVCDTGYSGGKNEATCEGRDPDSETGAFCYSCYLLPDGTVTKALDVQYGLNYEATIAESYGIPGRSDGIVTAEATEDALIVTIEDTTESTYGRAVKTFRFDPETLLLTSDSTVTYDSAGNTVLEREASYACLTDYTPAQSAMDLCKESETPCRITLHYYPGEETSQTVQFSVDPATAVRVVEAARDQTAKLYLDEACTQEVDGTNPLDLSQGDVTLYVKGIV